MKTIESRVVADNPHWSYCRDRYELSDGHRADYFYVRSVGSVMVVVLDELRRFVMVEQPRYLWRRSSLEFPGGGVGDGESAQVAAARELREETGLEVPPNDLREVGAFNPCNGMTDERCRVFAAQWMATSRWTWHEPRPDAEERVTLRQLTEHDLVTRVASGEIWDGMTMACWAIWRATADRRSGQ